MAKNKQSKILQQSPASSGVGPYEQVSITKDLAWVVVLNVLILAILLGFYYTNLHTQYLERWFEKFLHIG